MIGVSSHQEPADDERSDQRGEDDAGRDLMPGAADGDDEEAETGRGHRSTKEIEGMFGARRRRQSLDPDRQRDQAERKVDREQPRPGTDRKNARGNRRSQA